ncbi:hypothetical protein NDU88_004163 [Pleurodeles waltl]|uniref:Uncharacterized protein n=1 Tax=Pleurodeles waltl TaxID=8319 RepID=A0AAV7V120_PLEWA|nr:hypothetical protein NDU88_004163 [Pleurodeles waltl]
MEVQREPEPTTETEAWEGEKTKAPAKAKGKKKGKQPKKEKKKANRADEGIEEDWSQVRSQRLRDKCRKEKEDKEERQPAAAKGQGDPLAHISSGCNIKKSITWLARLCGFKVPGM